MNNIYLAKAWRNTIFFRTRRHSSTHSVSTLKSVITFQSSIVSVFGSVLWLLALKEFKLHSEDLNFSSIKISYLTNRFHVAVRQRWRQNVVKTKKWHTSRRRVCHCYIYHILTSSVIYYWTDPRPHGIYLFYTMIRKEKDRYTYLPRTAWPFEDLC